MTEGRNCPDSVWTIESGLSVGPDRGGIMPQIEPEVREDTSSNLALLCPLGKLPAEADIQDPVRARMPGAATRLRRGRSGEKGRLDLSCRVIYSADPMDASAGATVPAYWLPGRFRP